MKPRTAIVTVTYNAQPFIEDFLSSVFKLIQENSHFFLVLVDNLSSDDTLSTVSNFVKRSDVGASTHIIPQTTNAGFGAGCNVGAQKARELDAHFIWFLNPDTTIDDVAANALLDTFTTHRNTSLVGCLLCDENGKARSTAYQFPRLSTVFTSTSTLGLLSRLPSSRSTLPLPSEVTTVEWTTGASFMVTSDCFFKLNGFDENYFLYFEELDLFFRAKKHGFVARVNPQSLVFHISGASTNINKKNQSQKPRLPGYWYESRRYYYLKNYSAVYFLCADLVYTAAYFLEKMKSFCKRRPSTLPKRGLSDLLSYSIIFNWKLKK